MYIVLIGFPCISITHRYFHFYCWGLLKISKEFKNLIVFTIYIQNCHALKSFPKMIHHFGVSPQKKSMFRSVEEDKIKKYIFYIFKYMYTFYNTCRDFFHYNMIKDCSIEQHYSLENSDVAFETECFKLWQKAEIGKKKEKRDSLWMENTRELEFWINWKETNPPNCHHFFNLIAPWFTEFYSTQKSRVYLFQL